LFLLQLLQQRRVKLSVRQKNRERKFEEVSAKKRERDSKDARDSRDAQTHVRDSHRTCPRRSAWRYSCARKQLHVCGCVSIDYPQLLIAGGQDVVKHLTVSPALLLRLCILHVHLLQLLLHIDKRRLQVLPVVQGRGHGKRVGQTTVSARDRPRDRGSEGASVGIRQGNYRRRSRRHSVLSRSTHSMHDYGLRPLVQADLLQF
jgi:hypothetical protein